MPRIRAPLLQLCGLIFLSFTWAFAAERDQKASDQQQYIVRDITLNQLGISEQIVFEVPQGARSFTVAVVGEPDLIYALSSLRTADGVEHVGWGETQRPGPILSKFYREEHLCHFPGQLRQCPRLGTFTLVYPNKPGQKLPSGTTSLHIAGEKPGSARVYIFSSEPNKADVLHLNLFTVSQRSTPFDAKLLAQKLQAIFDQAKIRIVIDNEIRLAKTSFSDLADLVPTRQRPSGAPTDPEETPDGAPAKLALLGNQRLPSSDALNVYLVDSFGGRGIKALSLGTPGPPLPSSYYFGVFIERSSNYETMSRLAAHEIAHFLGLDHPTRWSASDGVYRDGLVSSAEVVTNLMGSGTELNEAQIYVITRSPLFRAQ